MKDCIFCKIGRGEIPAPRLYEDEHAFAIRDLHPQAKEHYLVIPKEHHADWNATPGALWEKLARAVKELAARQGLAQGFRVVANTGSHAGQTVFHLHLHVLGGEPLGHFGR